MPNWCYQNLTVKGDNAELSRLIKETEQQTDEGEKYISFNALIPCPQELTDTVEGSYGDEEKQKALEEQQKKNLLKYGFRTWYDWAEKVYGTKWGACDVSQHTELTPTSSYINYSFQSAWSPAMELLSGMSMLFPTLTFGVSFTEESDAYAGWIILQNGETVGAEEYEIDSPTSEQYPDEDDWRNAYEEWATDFTDSLASDLSKAMQSV